MDVTTIHSVADGLAGYISELTVGDLSRPTHTELVDVGDLILNLFERYRKVSIGVMGETEHSAPLSRTLDRETLTNSANLCGGGFESEHRSSARILEAAFARYTDPRAAVSVPGIPGTHDIAELIEMQIRDTAIQTWDIVQALDIDDYAPSSEVENRIVQYIQAHPRD